MHPVPRSTTVAIAALLVATSLCHAAEEKLTPKNLKAARRAAAWKTRRIIMNNDGNDSREAKQKTREAFLNSRSTPLAGTQTDAIFYCDGIWGTFTHRSPTADLRAGSDRGYKEWAVDLVKDGGPDPLASVIGFGHRNGMEVFWSLRMNDTHDSGDPTMMSDWKKSHSGCLVGKLEDRGNYRGGGRRWSAVDYSKKKVRDRTVGWFDEVAEKYDVDGFELDFFRHPIFFKNPLHGKPATEENLDRMTEVIRRIREVADRHALRRGRPILLTVRLPDSVGYCREMGLDLRRWLEAGLIDMMTVSGYFRLNPWKTSVELGHHYNVPVYASLSDSRIRQPKRKFKSSIEEYRARAMDAWKSGVDGIYIFNLFNPNSPVFREVGDPASLATMDKVYTTGARSVKVAQYWIADGLKYLGRPYPLPDRPQTLSMDKPVTVALNIWDDLAGVDSKRRATLRLCLTDLAQTSRLTVTLNGHTLKEGTLSADGLVVYPIPSDHLKVGENQFVFTLTTPQPTEAKGKNAILRDLYVLIENASSK